MTALVEVRSLRKEFGAVVAVDDISFTVAKGEVLGFLGPNGAGKSTTMKMVAGFLKPTTGTASIGGADIRTNPIAAKQKLVYLPEGSPLYGDMTPEGLLDFVGQTRKIPAAARRKMVEKAIERMALQEVLHRRIETLSKGFRRRVGLAQAILHDPEVLILDEPTDGLDPNQKHEVRELIRSMGDEKAIIISTHILEEVDAVCDRAIIIDHGRLVSDGTPAQLHSRSPDFNAVALKVQPSDFDRALKALRALATVKSVDAGAKGEGFRSLMVRPKDGKFIADAVAQTLAANKITPIDVQAIIGTLDDVFRRLTAGKAE